jgi:hypothetical protein
MTQRKLSAEVIDLDKSREVPALLDSLQELFNELNDRVAPADVAERMSQKLNRTISLPQVAILMREAGFYCVSAKKCNGQMRRFIYRDLELLAKLQSESSQMVVRAEACKDFPTVSPCSFKKPYNFWWPHNKFQS